MQPLQKSCVGRERHCLQAIENDRRLATAVCVDCTVNTLTCLVWGTIFSYF